MKRFITSLVFAGLAAFGSMTVSDIAFAQEANAAKADVKLVVPAGWEDRKDEAKDGRIAVYVDPKTEHRIEVMARFNTRDTHAKALFEAFHEQLKTTLDDQINNEQSYVLEGGAMRTGQYVAYETRESDVPISVATFAFTTKDIAYIVIGYFANAKREAGLQAFEAFIQSMTDI